MPIKKGSSSNIRSNIPREEFPNYTVVNNMEPQNVASIHFGRDTAGKDTRNIEKSDSKPGIGPKQAGL